MVSVFFWGIILVLCVDFEGFFFLVGVFDDKRLCVVILFRVFIRFVVEVRINLFWFCGLIG